ncbi:MAG: RNA polymerase sigma-70 factor [Candidatus Hydrogenedentes bacterium]|nr:RNA polymerase sigma-70 factor [Candidatus Hydrogenedentota bacterium]
MDHETHFLEHRRLLFSVAYRMLGSVVEAEDAVQECYLRWQATPLDTVDNPRAFLLTIVTRWSIDQLRSARHQRESYTGTWLPEPLVDRSPAPDAQAALTESLSMAFLVLLEALSPQERAVYLLHDIFQYSFAETAHMLGKPEAACRQMGKRARGHVHARHQRYSASREEQERLTHAFLFAAGSGDAAALKALLTEDAVCYSDHGGKAAAAKRTIHTADKVARFIIGVSQRFAPEALRVELATINGQPGILYYDGPEPYGAMTFAFTPHAIQALYVIRNPDKLRHLHAQHT